MKPSARWVNVTGGGWTRPPNLHSRTEGGEGLSTSFHPATRLPTTPTPSLDRKI